MEELIDQQQHVDMYTQTDCELDIMVLRFIVSRNGVLAGCLGLHICFLDGTDNGIIEYQC